MASELTEVLTDKDIDDLLTDNQKNGDAYATAYEVRELCAELRTRRAREKALVEALAEAIDWATPFNGRHDKNNRGYSSQVMPMFIRIGERNRNERLAALLAILEAK